MRTQIGEFVKLRDGRFGFVVDLDWDPDDGDTYFIKEHKTDKTIIARPNSVVGVFNPNEMEEDNE